MYKIWKWRTKLKSKRKRVYLFHCNLFSNIYAKFTFRTIIEITVSFSFQNLISISQIFNWRCTFRFSLVNLVISRTNSQLLYTKRYVAYIEMIDYHSLRISQEPTVFAMDVVYTIKKQGHTLYCSLIKVLGSGFLLTNTFGF